MHSEGPRSIDGPNEESSCFSAYLLNSISPTRSPCRIHPSLHPSIYLSSDLSICPSIFIRSHTAIHPYTYPICSSVPPTIYPSITTLVNKDTSGIDMVSNWPDWSMSCIQALFIFRELIRGRELGNLIKWLPWFQRMAVCVFVSMLKIDKWPNG